MAPFYCRLWRHIYASPIREIPQPSTRRAAPPASVSRQKDVPHSRDRGAFPSGASPVVKVFAAIGSIDTGARKGAHHNPRGESPVNLKNLFPPLRTSPDGEADFGPNPSFGEKRTNDRTWAPKGVNPLAFGNTADRTSATISRLLLQSMLPLLCILLLSFR